MWPPTCCRESQTSPLLKDTVMIWENLFNGLDHGSWHWKRCVYIRTLVIPTAQPSVEQLQWGDIRYLLKFQWSESNSGKQLLSQYPTLSPPKSLDAHIHTSHPETAVTQDNTRHMVPPTTQQSVNRSSNPHPSISAAPRALQNLYCPALGNGPTQHKEFDVRGSWELTSAKHFQHEPLRGGGHCPAQFQGGQ